MTGRTCRALKVWDSGAHQRPLATVGETNGARTRMETKAGERWLGSASAKQMQEGCFLGGGSWPVLPVVCLATL